MNPMYYVDGKLTCELCFFAGIHCAVPKTKRPSRGKPLGWPLKKDDNADEHDSSRRCCPEGRLSPIVRQVKLAEPDQLSPLKPGRPQMLPPQRPDSIGASNMEMHGISMLLKAAKICS